MKNLLAYLPEGWEEKAKELGAMERKSGVIKEASSLLRLNMLYVTNGGSYQQASMGMALTEDIRISKVAAHKRIGNSNRWLRWMAEELCKKEGLTIPKPEFLGDRQLVLIDASDETVKGGSRSEYRLHYAFNLFEFKCNSMEVTKTDEGEKLTRYKIQPNEIAISDRAYCTINGIEHVINQQGGFIVRFRSKAFKLYDEVGNTIDILSKCSHLQELEHMDINCSYKSPSGLLRPIRLVVMKKDEKAIEQCKKKMRRMASKKQRNQASPTTQKLNEYIVLATNLDYSNEQVTELYRARWQIEQVFFRLKSLFGYGNTPNKREDTVLAWFYGKLLLSVLCETILKGMSFPPEDKYEFEFCYFVGAQFMV